VHHSYHANSGKKFQGQKIVWQDVINQRMDGNRSIAGLMLESNLYEGSQKLSSNMDEMAYGVSVTDECISWETTEELVTSAHNHLLPVIQAEENVGEQNLRYSVSAA